MAVTNSNTKNAHPESGYRAYLLRCWQEAGAEPGGEPVWRFVLARAGDGETQRGFASLEALVGHLREELAAAGREDKVTAR